MFLTAEEVYLLTNRVQHNAQMRVLRAMGIEHKPRPDGTIAVLTAHVEHVFGGTLPSAKLKETEPDWSAVS